MNKTPRWIATLAPCVALAIAAGCSAARPRVMTAATALAIRDTVAALENATNLAVDRLDCAAAFELIGSEEPAFVSNSHVVRDRSRFRKACDALVAPRTGAEFAADTVSVHPLSADAAYVVKEGVYTIHFKDGTSRREYLVMTSIWRREGGSWKMVHLHESSRPLGQ